MKFEFHETTSSSLRRLNQYPSCQTSRALLYHFILTMQFLLVIIVIPLLLVVLRCCVKAPRRPLPPGPVPLPVIGNILQIPREAPLKRIREWTRTFGPILTFKIGSRTWILLASRTAVRDLLGKKSTLYNNRPMLILGEHILDGIFPVLMPGGNKWHQLHQLSSYLLNPQAAKASRSLLSAAAACSLRDMVYGKDLCDHLLLVSVRPFSLSFTGWTCPLSRMIRLGRSRLLWLQSLPGFPPKAQF